MPKFTSGGQIVPPMANIFDHAAQTLEQFTGPEAPQFRQALQQFNEIIVNGSRHLQKQQAMEAALDELVNKLQLGAEQFETAALILRTESEAKEAARILKEKLENTGFDMENRFSYLHRDSTSFCKGLTVTTFYLAKGLEFDQVFSLFPAADQSPIAKQGRYIAATRALHKLHMYEYGK